MSDKTSRYVVDYFSYFNKLFETWEESTNNILDIWLNSPMLERAVEKSTELNKYINGFITQTLENRCVQNNEDENIADYVMSLERKVSELERKVKELEAKKTIVPESGKPGSRRSGTSKPRNKEK